MAYIGQAPTPLPLTATDIPDLPATKITSGTFPALNGSNLTNLDASDLTGTLPAISGANLTGVSAGKVLQVTYNRQNTQFNTTNGSYTDTGIVSTALTPASTSNKVLIHFTGHFNMRDQSGNFFATLYRSIGGSDTQLVGGRGLISSDGQASQSHVRPHSCVYLDSPNTTSAVTYKLYAQVEVNGTIHIAYDSGNSHQFLTMEIEG